MRNHLIKLIKKIFSFEYFKTILFPIFSLMITLFIATQQMILQKRLEDVRVNLTKSDLSIKRGQVASSLIDNIKGTEFEQRAAKMILLSMGDTMLATQIFAAVSKSDTIEDSVRIQAIRELGKTGNVRVALNVLNDLSKNNSRPLLVKKEAYSASLDALNRSLLAANAFFENGRFQIAAEYYKQAITSINLNSNEEIINTIAESNFNHKLYKDAALKYREIFLKRSKN